jgi:hypothetical protein
VPKLAQEKAVEGVLIKYATERRQIDAIVTSERKQSENRAITERWQRDDRAIEVPELRPQVRGVLIVRRTKKVDQAPREQFVTLSDNPRNGTGGSAGSGTEATKRHDV